MLYLPAGSGLFHAQVDQLLDRPFHQTAPDALPSSQAKGVVQPLLMSREVIQHTPQGCAVAARRDLTRHFPNPLRHTPIAIFHQTLLATSPQLSEGFNAQGDRLG